MKYDFLLKGWFVSYGSTNVSEQRNVIQSGQPILWRTMRAGGRRWLGGGGEKAKGTIIRSEVGRALTQTSFGI